MMKKLSLIVLPLLAFSCSSGEQKASETKEATEATDTTEVVEMVRSDWENEHLLGKVKSFEETPYTPDENGQIDKMDSCCVGTEEYNKEGFMVHFSEKNSDGEMTSVTVLERDEMGRMMSYTSSENGKETFKRVMTRDEEGKVLEAMDSDSTGQVTRMHKVEKVNRYDQALSGNSYLADGTHAGAWSFDYVDGQRVGNSWVDSTGVQRVHRSGKVNDKGWISEVVDVRIGAEGDTTTTVETYTYDSFDDTGNWTQRTKHKDNEPAEVLKRSYTYYKE